MKQILLLLPTASYRNEAFLAAGKALGVEIITAADYCHQLAPSWGLAPMLALHFDRPAEAAETVLKSLPQKPDAVLAVDDSGLELAALLAERLALPGNLPQAVRLTHDKLAFRQLQRQHGFPCPDFQHLADNDDPIALLPKIRFPAVVKTRRLSASRGVIRVNTEQEYQHAVSWARDIQGKADRDAKALGLIIEDFIPGSEHALEGMLNAGQLSQLTLLALFDKPDPLDGPYFEETIYVTPSRLPEKTRIEILAAVENICRLAGLTTGPIHAEMRINAAGVWLLEVAARSIGGLCGRVLTHALGMPIEQLILQQAINLAPSLPPPANVEASGVMMIPIPRRGIYRGVHNVEAALKIPDITDIRMVAHPGQTLLLPPEGASYLGFIFSRAATPAAAEIALRTAHRLLAFDIVPEHALRVSDL